MAEEAVRAARLSLNFDERDPKNNMTMVIQLCVPIIFATCTVASVQRRCISAVCHLPADSPHLTPQRVRGSFLQDSYLSG